METIHATNGSGLCGVCMRVVLLSTAAGLGDSDAEKSLREILETSKDQNAKLLALGTLSRIANVPGKAEPETNALILAFCSDPINQQVVVEARRIFSIKI